MKNILVSAALAFFAISASAQTKPVKESNPVSTAAKESTLTGREKGRAISEPAKSKGKNELDREDNETDVKLTREEKHALKAARKAEKRGHKADLKDDGIINDSQGKNEHGAAVSGVAKGTTLEGKEKGMAVRDAARIKAKNGEKAKHPEMKKPAKTAKAPRPEKPSGAGRPAGHGGKH